jgi:hypothetical protein
MDVVFQSAVSRYGSALVFDAGEIAYFRDGDRWDVDATVYDLKRKPESVDTFDRVLRRKTRAIIADSYTIDYSRTGFDRKKEGELRRVRYAPNTSPRKTKSYVPAQLQGAEAFEGYFSLDPVKIQEVLRGASDIQLRQRMEEIDGNECHVVEADTHRGHYTIWFDPKSGYLPRKATVTKDKYDLLGDRRIIDFEPFNDDSPKPNKIQMTGCAWSMDSVQVECIGGISIPTKCRQHSTMSFSNGRTIETDRKLSRSNVDFAPDFGRIGAFKPDIPDGTPVHHVDVPYIKFLWLGGELVADVDEAVQSAIEEEMRRTRSGVASVDTNGVESKDSNEHVKDSGSDSRSNDKEVFQGLHKPGASQDPALGAGYSTFLGIAVLVLVSMIVALVVSLARKKIKSNA